MGTVSTTKQIADHRRRIAMIVDRSLVTAYEEYARRELTTRSDMMRRILLEGLPNDLRQRVEDDIAQGRD